MIQCSDDSILCRSAFTLLELLVTLTIIVVLVGILVPGIMKSVGKAHRIRLQGDLQTISSALEAYRADFGDYPRAQYAVGVNNADAGHPNPPTGAEILCRALIAPAPAVDPNANPPIPAQDGADGPGFRLHGIIGSETTPQGRVYGPYIAADKFQVFSLYSTTSSVAPVMTSSNQPVAGSSGAPANPFYPLTSVILDIDGNPILYFPARSTKPDITGGANNKNQGYLGSVSSPPSTLNLPANSFTQFSLFNSDDGWLYMHYFFHDGQCVWRSPVDGTEGGGSTVDDSTIGFKRIAIMFGDYNGENPTAITNFDGSIDGTGENAITQPFVLWCAGQDGKYGPDCLSKDQTQFQAPSSKQIIELDDVTNAQ